MTKHYVNLGIAVAGPRGLVVPNVKDAQDLPLRGPGAGARRADRARPGRRARRPADLSGGTITITNVGVFGVDAGVPILNPGEAAILALGAVQRRPWEHDGDVALRDVVTLSLAFDHRLVDGRGSVALLARRWARSWPTRPTSSPSADRPVARSASESNSCSPARKRAQLALEILELAHQAHRLLTVERRSAGTQHGERPPQRLQLVPPLHERTNIRSLRPRARGRRPAPVEGPFRA